MDGQKSDNDAADDGLPFTSARDDLAEAEAVLGTDFARYFLSLPDPPDSSPEPDPTPWELEEQSRTTAGADQLAAQAASIEPGERTAQILALLKPSALSAGGVLDAARAAERLASWIHATQLRHLAAFACPGVAAASADLNAYASAPGQPLHSPKPAGGSTGLELDDLPTSGSAIHGDQQRNLALVAAAHKVAAAEVSAALLISPLNAGRRVAQATTYVEELPATLKALSDGIIDRGRAMVIADRTQNLPTDLRHRVEKTVVAKAATRTAGQLRAIADRAVIAVDPEAAKKRHEIAKRSRGVSLRPDEDGMSQLRADLTADKACTAFNLIDQVAMFNARDTAEHRPIGALRADAFSDIFDQLTDHGIVDLHHLLSSRDNAPTENSDTCVDETADASGADADPPISGTNSVNEDRENETRATTDDSTDGGCHEPDPRSLTNTGSVSPPISDTETDPECATKETSMDIHPLTTASIDGTGRRHRGAEADLPDAAVDTAINQGRSGVNLAPGSDDFDALGHPTADPADAADSADPVNPAELTEPHEPADPVDPPDRVNPPDGVNPADAADSADPVNPAELVDPADPVDPPDRVNPADPVDPPDRANPPDPVNPAELADTADPHEHADLPDRANPPDGVNPADAADSADRVNSAELADPADSAESVGPADPADGVEPCPDPLNESLPAANASSSDVATNCVCGRSEPWDRRLQRGLGSHQGRPTNLNITMAATTLAGLDDLPAELDGHGPIHPDIARALLSSAATITAVAVNPTCGTALDLGRTVYRPRLAQRDYVTKRDQTCRFPSCRQPAWRCQIDHSNEFCPGSNDSGVTCPCNLTCLCKFHHDLKTFRLWDTEHHPDGSITWTSPIGRTYTTQTRQWLTGMTDPASADPDSEARMSGGADRSDSAATSAATTASATATAIATSSAATTASATATEVATSSAAATSASRSPTTATNKPPNLDPPF